MHTREEVKDALNTAQQNAAPAITVAALEHYLEHGKLAEAPKDKAAEEEPEPEKKRGRFARH
jgi:hypothetical protein